ncbi:hypothetical protein GLOTRDRAFT_141228 [Gloeophyllum trabeum ATCC 11539]|uniref:tRNA-splicing endonuclease subunit Sen54 N-terminal domain-containing protein n=1 Tax=Gloeophyllum trabeum (strain ATCC 11539 / FP-39264 / Madison 617) TaxID=670483 RepID=S7RF31_GLOTA|nr:uncharacterized protein GLOTRDRAFT_141228 [Gloeophyllum trabeum ATCC 11539]EPQ51094.1 hypothetical protein GLOTRDRAFT_141228 [Gloeophyllum trabeum ATCC 11539]
MDDSLERPNILPPPASNEAQDDGQSSEEEDGGPDWTKLPSSSGPNAARPVIPKRGEKDYEPKAGGGSGLQLHFLDRARTAMFGALGANRGVNNKSMSYGLWYPQLARAHVTVAKGIHFTSMGHFVQRASADSQTKLQKRLELLPEEALYLVERGALWCWKQVDVVSESVDATDPDGRGPPMSVQQAYAEMIGTQDLTLEKYQVFAYLKRLGYIVTRAEPPSPSYPVPPPLQSSTPRSVLNTLQSIWSGVCRRLRALIGGSIDWWRPLYLDGWLYHYTNYPSLFKSMRFIHSGHSTPLHLTSKPASAPRSPYHIFYHLYKPSTPFRKTSPPPPDFYVVVVDARNTPMPSLHELAALYDELPDVPPPLPRQRLQPVPDKPAGVPSTTPQSLSTLQQILHSVLPFLSRAPAEPPIKPRKPHPFMALKAGKKMVVMAAVDNGIISFFRFGQGAFDEWPMV